MMREVVDNIWKCHKASPSHWVVVSTNGFVKSNGACVMGRGIALEAARKFPTLPFELGKKLRDEGNHVFMWHEYGLVTFPVKHAWWEVADLVLLRRSALELAAMFKGRTDIVCMPKVGCANGKLEWAVVKPVLESAFKDWPHVLVVDRVATKLERSST